MVTLYIALQLGFYVMCVITLWLLSYLPRSSRGGKWFFRVIAVSFLADLLIGPVVQYVTQPVRALAAARREAARGVPMFLILLAADLYAIVSLVRFIRRERRGS